MERSKRMLLENRKIQKIVEIQGNPDAGEGRKFPKDERGKVIG